jgi:hypothetical protein
MTIRILIMDDEPLDQKAHANSACKARFYKDVTWGNYSLTKPLACLIAASSGIKKEKPLRRCDCSTHEG